MQVILLGTSDCHLCEDAIALLIEMGIMHQFVDIMDNSDDFSQYQYIIPVLKVSDKTMSWPFNRESIQHFFKEIEKN